MIHRHTRSPFVIIACLTLAASSCSEPREEIRPVAPAVTDTKPVGEGLKVLGFAFLGSAVVIVLGRMIR